MLLATVIPCAKVQFYILICGLVISLIGFRRFVGVKMVWCRTSAILTKFHHDISTFTQIVACTDGQAGTRTSISLVFSNSFRCCKQPLDEQNMLREYKNVLCEIWIYIDINSDNHAFIAELSSFSSNFFRIKRVMNIFQQLERSLTFRGM